MQHLSMPRPEWKVRHVACGCLRTSSWLARNPTPTRDAGADRTCHIPSSTPLLLHNNSHRFALGQSELLRTNTQQKAEKPASGRRANIDIVRKSNCTINRINRHDMAYSIRLSGRHGSFITNQNCCPARINPVD